MVLSAPFVSKPYAIEKQWIDYNGHFNMAYYNVLFDRDSDVSLAFLGLGPEYIQRTGNSYFTLEAHVSYLRELHVDDTVVIETQILDFDAKRLHYVQTMRHATEGWIACITENIIMNIDMRTKKSAPMSDDILKKIQIAHDSHKLLPVPPQVGHRIGIHRKT